MATAAGVVDCNIDAATTATTTRQWFLLWLEAHTQLKINTRVNEIVAQGFLFISSLLFPFPCGRLLHTAKALMLFEKCYRDTFHF